MRISEDLTHDWRFHAGDILRTNHSEGMQAYRPRYHWSKSGLHHMPSMPAFDDSTWDVVQVPHDWAIAGLPNSDPAVDVNHGSRVGGIGWYRRTFTVAETAADQRVWLQFDGVFRDCEIWINGSFAGSNRSEYSGFELDVSEWVRFGAANSISVRVDASDFEGWWYEGAGIYRGVRLVTCAATHLLTDGIFACPRTSDQGWGFEVFAELGHVGAEPSQGDMHISITQAGGKEDGTEVAAEVAATTMPWKISADGTLLLKTFLPIAHPQLWTPDNPHLYELTVRVLQENVVVDALTVRAGLRTIAVDPARGFLLNGQPVKLKGVSCHQDFAALGTALPDAVQDYRIGLLKAMGANAYRTAHHAPTPALLEACDRLGMLVMDETRMFGTSTEGISQLTRLVRRDRNHPSVVMWSMGNEEMGLQGNDNGCRIARRLRRLVYALDGSRPVTLAMNGDWLGPLAADPTCVDVVGFNYGPDSYDEFHRDRPSRPLIGSETGAYLATRGHYGPSRWQGHLTWNQHVEGSHPTAADDFDPGYCQADGDTSTAFGGTPWDTWRAVADRDFVMGTFIWTGFDYRGEPCPRQRWPSINSNYGIMDLCGFPKDAWWYYRAWWQDQPTIHLLPHWQWPGREGEAIAVRCFSNAATVELFLNGVSQGSQSMVRNGFLQWQVPYVAGTVLAVGTWPDGRMERTHVHTPGTPTRVALTATTLPRGADRRVISMLTLAMQDEAGHAIATGDALIHLETTGGLRILGVHNGDPAFTAAEQASQVCLFNGLALVVLEQLGDGGGMVTAHGNGLISAQFISTSAEKVRPWSA